VRYTLKTPYRDGTTHVIFEPEDLMARLAALVPKPRAHLTRYHGVFASASPDRPRIVPATRAAAANQASPHGAASAADCSPNLTWAQRLKRVFAIDIKTCRQCGGRLRLGPERGPRPAISPPDCNPPRPIPVRTPGRLYGLSARGDFVDRPALETGDFKCQSYRDQK
jgi:hypothetical protein